MHLSSLYHLTESASAVLSVLEFPTILPLIRNYWGYRCFYHTLIIVSMLITVVGKIVVEPYLTRILLPM